MKSNVIPPESIDDYLEAFPEAVRAVLQNVRRTIARAAPGATEAIKYRLPTFVFHGNLIHFGAFKNHLGFYALPTGHARFRRELAAYATGKGSVQFPLGKPMPYALIRRIVKFRVRENEARAAARPPRRPANPARRSSHRVASAGAGRAGRERGSA